MVGKTINDQLKNLSDQIQVFKLDIGVLKEEMMELRDQINGTNGTAGVRDVGEDLEGEVIERMKKEKQVFMGNVTEQNEAEIVIDIAGNNNVNANSIKAITSRGNGDAEKRVIGYVAEFETMEDKIKILKGSKNLKNDDNLKKVFVKPNLTIKQQRVERELYEKVKELRNKLEDTDNQFPVIRNGRIIFLERRNYQNQPTDKQEPTRKVQELLGARSKITASMYTM